MADIIFTHYRRKGPPRVPPEFANYGPSAVVAIRPEPHVKKQWTILDPVERELDNTKRVSDASTNTTRIPTTSRGMVHLEGGWPLSVDTAEEESKWQYTKKLERDEKYLAAVQRFQNPVFHALRENNALNMYESYFVGEEGWDFTPPSLHSREVLHPSISGCIVQMTISSAGGHLAAAVGGRMETATVPSAVWDLEAPMTPVRSLVPVGPSLCCLMYSARDPHMVAGGGGGGKVQLWDMRQDEVAGHSEVDHGETVTDIRWLPAKTGEVLTVSMDCTVRVWDIRKLDHPVETTPLYAPVQDQGGRAPSMFSMSTTVSLLAQDKPLAGLCLDYDPAVGGPSKFLVGTQQGTILNCTRRAPPSQRIAGSFEGHHGPVYAVARAPTLPTTILSVGDWTARIWVDGVSHCVLQTPYCESFLSTACWHPSAPAVFLCGRMDGKVEVWDMLNNHHAPAAVSNLSLRPVTCMAPIPNRHDLLAIGSSAGSIHMCSLSIQDPSPDTQEEWVRMVDHATRHEQTVNYQATDQGLYNRQVTVFAESAEQPPDLAEEEAKYLATVEELLRPPE